MKELVSNSNYSILKPESVEEFNNMAEGTYVHIEPRFWDAYTAAGDNFYVINHKEKQYFVMVSKIGNIKIYNEDDIEIDKSILQDSGIDLSIF